MWPFKKKVEKFDFTSMVMPRTFRAFEGGQVYNLTRCDHMWSIWSSPYRFGNGFNQARQCKTCKLTQSVELNGISEVGAEAIKEIPYEGAVIKEEK